VHSLQRALFREESLDMTIPMYSDEIPYVTTEQMIEVDRAMMEDYRIELIQMMEMPGATWPILPGCASWMAIPLVNMWSSWQERAATAVARWYAHADCTIGVLRCRSWYPILPKTLPRSLPINWTLCSGCRCLSLWLKLPDTWEALR